MTARQDRPEPRPGLDLIPGYHSPQVDVAVRLNTNESPYPPPEAWRDEFLSELHEVDYHRYPDRGATELRTALADHHGVDPAQVLVGNGSNEVLQAVCLAYGGPGRSAAVFEPTYALHSHIASVCGTEVVVGERAADFTLDPVVAGEVLAAAQPAITFLCSPNNPTGLVEPADTVAAVVDAAPGLVVVDEAYGQFSPWTALSLVDDGRPLLVTRTFSKTWALAALRLGYLVGPRWVVEQLEKVVLPYHVDAAKQVAGRVALRYVGEMEARIAAVVEERGRISSALSELEVDVYPSGANFVLFRPRRLDADEVWRGLVDQSVLVRSCTSWPGLQGCLRVTVGTSAENDAFLSAVTGMLKGR